MGKGLFLTIEGGEGAGKTSIITPMKDYLETSGYPTMITREPGGIAISEQIREVLLNKENIGIDGRTEALLYAAARRQHLIEKIVPALNQGISVICDRFVDSSLAYQGYARGLGIDEILKINEFAIKDVMPDLTLLLDLDPVVGMARIRKNINREVNRLDLEAMEFHEKVREGYLAISERFKNRMVIINANQIPKDVLKDVIMAISLRLPSILENKM